MSWDENSACFTIYSIEDEKRLSLLSIVWFDIEQNSTKHTNDTTLWPESNTKMTVQGHDIVVMENSMQIIAAVAAWASQAMLIRAGPNPSYPKW